MSSVCQTLTTGSIVLSYNTAEIPSIIITTAPASTITTSIPIVTSSCISNTPPAQTCGLLGNSSCPISAPVCITSTSFISSTITSPGSIFTSTTFSPSVSTITSNGVSTITTCSFITSPTSTSKPSTSSTSSTSSSIPSSTSPSSTTSSSSTSSSTTSAPIVPPTSVNLDSTITSYSTVLSTLTGANGQVTTATSIAPITQNNTGSSNSGSNNVGAIVGGTIAGILGLTLLLFGIWFARKRGYFGLGRSDEDQFSDDMWAPNTHGGTGITGQAVAPDPGEEEEMVHREMSEVNGGVPGGAGNAAGYYARPQSWQTQTSGSHYNNDGQGGGYRPDYGLATAVGAGGVQRATSNGSYANGASVSRNNSGPSSHSHDGNYSQNGGSPQQFSSPTFNGRQQSQQQYQQQQHFYPVQPLNYIPEDTRQADLSRIPSSSGHSESTRTHATSGSTAGGLAASLSMHPLPQSNVYNHNDYLATSDQSTTRPPLEVLPESLSSSQSSDSNSSRSNNDSTPPSAMQSIFTTMTDGYISASPNHSPTTSSNGSHSGLKRQASVESLMPPSQFLGARIVNVVTPREEKGSMDFNIENLTPTNAQTLHT